MTITTLGRSVKLGEPLAFVVPASDAAIVGGGFLSIVDWFC